MVCFHPISGYRRADGALTFKEQESSRGMMTVACGRCIGCRVARSKMWAARCIHEASLHERNCFITLTYDQDHVPSDMSLNHRHWQLFMKRLRKKYGPNIRFYMCGEYGDKFGRPHFHGILFNFDFPDKILWKKERETPLFTSESLQTLWPQGFSTIGAASYESAAYCARYVMKKINGPQAEEHYQYFNEITGEITQRKPEYNLPSNRPGIGYNWFKTYAKELFPDDFIIVKGRKSTVPKYYTDKFKASDPDEFFKVELEREAKQWLARENSTPERLAVREKVLKARMTYLERVIE